MWSALIAISLTPWVRRRKPCRRLLVTLFAGLAPAFSPNGVLSEDNSSSGEERVPILEQVCGRLIASGPAASSLSASTVMGGTS